MLWVRGVRALGELKLIRSTFPCDQEKSGLAESVRGSFLGLVSRYVPLNDAHGEH